MQLPLAFLEGIGGPELMLIMFLVLLLFGADRLPELARGFGKSMREFKKAASGIEHEIKQAMEEKPESSAEAKRLAPPPVTPPSPPPPPKTFPPYPPAPPPPPRPAPAPEADDLP